ncbi:glycine cleavage system protein GcvH [bacterium]|nr:glycine cleavage system protein GcvH [bacterium]
MSVHQDYLYTESHEWIEASGDVRRIGITDHAQHLFGDIVFTELPEVGRVVKKGDSLGTIESPKAASDLYAPISGEVVEVNTVLNGAPETINQSPYGDGWIVKLRPSDPSEAEALLSPDKYEEIAEG